MNVFYHNSPTLSIGFRGIKKKFIPPRKKHGGIRISSIYHFFLVSKNIASSLSVWQPSNGSIAEIASSVSCFA